MRKDPDTTANRLTGAAWRLQRLMELYKTGSADAEVISQAIAQIGSTGDDYFAAIMDMDDDALLEYLREKQAEA